MVHRNDSAKRRLFVRGQRSSPRFAKLFSLTHAARIRVLENSQRGRVVRKFRDQIRRRRQVQNVVVGKFLPVQLLEVLGESPVESGALVRILAVTQRLPLRGLQDQHRRQHRRRLLQRQGWLNCGAR